VRWFAVTHANIFVPSSLNKKPPEINPGVFAKAQARVLSAPGHALALFASW
jgi:hypothetical protein